MKLIEAGWSNLVEAPLTATSVSTTATLFCPADSQYIDSSLNLSTATTATKACPQQPKYPLDNGKFFSATDEKIKNSHEIW